LVGKNLIAESKLQTLKASDSRRPPDVWGGFSLHHVKVASGDCRKQAIALTIQSTQQE
jgi:hypothetical protein